MRRNARALLLFPRHTLPWGVVEVNPLAAGEGGASGPLVCRRKSSRDAPRCACGSPRSGTTETESGKPSRAGGESAGTTAEEARLALTHFDGIPPMWVVGHAADAGGGDVARPARRLRLRPREGRSSNGQAALYSAQLGRTRGITALVQSYEDDLYPMKQPHFGFTRNNAQLC